MRPILYLVMLCALTGCLDSPAPDKSIFPSQGTTGLTRLATVWNITGSIESVSMDGSLAVILDSGKILLISSQTGEIVDMLPLPAHPVEGAFYSDADLSFDNQVVILFSRGPEDFSTRGFNLETENLVFEMPGFGWLSDDHHFLYSSEDNNSFITDVVTGEVILQTSGWLNIFTAHQPFFLAHTPYITDSCTGNTTVIERTTATIIANFAGICTQGSHNKIWYSIYDGHSAKIVNLANGQHITTLPGSVYAISSNGQFVILENPSSYFALIDIISEEVITQLSGSVFAFTPDSKFVLISTYNPYTVALYEVSTGQVIFADRGSYITVSEDSRFIYIANQEESTAYIYSLTDRKIWRHYNDYSSYPSEVQFSLDSQFLKLGKYLIEVESGYHIALGKNIFFSSNNILVSNGVFLDIYGLSGSAQPGTRAGGGLGFLSHGNYSIPIYPEPEAKNPTGNVGLGNAVSVLGRYGDEWLYITYITPYISPYTEPIQNGWVQADLFEKMEPWDDAPILDPTDPLGSLREISEAQ